MATAPPIRIPTDNALIGLAGRADAAAARAVAARRRRAIDLVGVAMSKVGRGGVAWTVVVAAAAARMRGPRAAPAAAAPVVGAFLASAAAARLFARRRPFQELPRVSPVGEKPHGPAFPSDQAASAGAAAFQLSQLLPRGARYFWTAALATSGSRVYVGAHYPSDVIAGGVLGVATARVWRRFVG